MVRHRLSAVGLSLLCLAVAPVLFAADPPLRKDKPLLFRPETATDNEPQKRQALADRVDQLIAQGWVRKGVKPASEASDAEFLRRISLDIAGRIPHASKVHEFVEDKTSDKRARKIDEVLLQAQYTNNFTTFWRNLLLPPSNNQQFQNFAVQLDPWLRKKLGDNTPYDQIVREVLTVELAGNQRGQFPGAMPANFNEPSPRGFYQANESKPENLAAATSRIFLGVRLECAQCHDHPFAKWKRKDFWQYAAFFAGVAPQAQDGGAYLPGGDSPNVREIKIPGKDDYVKARFLDGSEPQWKNGVSTRATLAEWMTSPKNPLFAKAAVNRLWAHLFGVGIIDPVDEPADDNPPSHPELLDVLAKAFIESGYDMKFLIGALTRTKAYQLSSAVSDPSQIDPRAFGRMSLKGLTGEQFFDSLALATGYDDRTPFNQRAFAGDFGQGTPRAEFLNKFSNFADKRTEFQTSILQALALMNGRFIDDMTSDDVNRSQALTAIQDAPFMTTEKRVEALIMSTLSRKPTAKELAKYSQYVNDGGPTGDKRKALGDLFWALLNSSEFILNH